MKTHYFAILFIPFTMIFYSCRNESKKTDPNDLIKTELAKIKVPGFDADTAYHFVKAQVDFGHRVPNTAAHKKCADYLFKTLSLYSDTAIKQSFRPRAYNGILLDAWNIIGVFNPDAKKRVLLCAHWDSRHVADHDKDVKNQKQSIEGANDGASGVGVLLEIARVLKTSHPKIGVDIVLFDAEDYGEPDDENYKGLQDTWCLGSQYWSSNPHIPGYRANFGILLDMVGAANSTFYQEGFSMQYAADIVRKVWIIAHRTGYGQYFIMEEGSFITDDHYYINKIARIPTIDIIHTEKDSPDGSFFEHWHTVDDTLDKISPQTLKAVGQTLLAVIFYEK